MKPHLVISFATASFFLAAPLTPAGEPDFTTPLIPDAAPPSSGDWEFSLSPYGFLVGLEGRVGIGPLAAEFDVGFDDVVDALEFGAGFSAEARKGRFALLGDFVYLAVAGDSTLSGPAASRAHLELDAFLFTGLAAYRLWDSPEGSFDLGAGVRLFSADTELEVRSRRGRVLGTRSRERDTWDGIVAARYVYQFNPKWSLRLYGDVGAGDSDLTWQVLANLGYSINDSTTLLVGYRHLDYDLSDGRINLDLAISGPQIGVVFEF